MFRSLAIIALLAGFAYVFIALYVYLFQTRLIYYPNAAGGVDRDPSALGLVFEDVRLTTADGTRIHGWFVPAPESQVVMLYFHGNAGNISHRLDAIALFHRLGLNVLIVDYRGYGHSEGSPDERGTYQDAEAAWEHLITERRYVSERIVIYGRSLGAAVASYLAGARSPATLMIESAFTSVPDLAAKLYPIFPVRWLARFEYDNLKRVAMLDCPVLIIHSADDNLIPIEHGRRLFQAAAAPKAFVETMGDHNAGFAFNEPRYSQSVGAFLDEHVPAYIPR